LSVQRDQKQLTKPVTVAITETPFDKRYCCWFCGEPSHVDFIFPFTNTHSILYHETKHLLRSCPHPKISVPCCSECQKIASKAQVDNIWAVNTFVKEQLLKRHTKDLAIGINWTQQELSSSEFEQGNFAGFAKSGWFIYEVAKSRVNYIGWPLVADGIKLDDSTHKEEQSVPFYFDGVLYPSITDAIEYFGNIFSVDPSYVSAVLQHMANGKSNEKVFAQVIRFCRLLVNATPTERKLAFNALVVQDE
jgi:hypothetical protein